MDNLRSLNRNTQLKYKTTIFDNKSDFITNDSSGNKNLMLTDRINSLLHGYKNESHRSAAYLLHNNVLKEIASTELRLIDVIINSNGDIEKARKTLEKTYPQYTECTQDIDNLLCLFSHRINISSIFGFKNVSRTAVQYAHIMINFLDSHIPDDDDMKTVIANVNHFIGKGEKYTKEINLQQQSINNTLEIKFKIGLNEFNIEASLLTCLSDHIAQKNIFNETNTRSYNSKYLEKTTLQNILQKLINRLNNPIGQHNFLNHVDITMDETHPLDLSSVYVNTNLFRVSISNVNFENSKFNILIHSSTLNNVNISGAIFDCSITDVSFNNVIMCNTVFPKNPDHYENFRITLNIQYLEAYPDKISGTLNSIETIQNPKLHDELLKQLMSNNIIIPHIFTIVVERNMNTPLKESFKWLERLYYAWPSDDNNKQEIFQLIQGELEHALLNKMGIPSVKYSEIKHIPNILNWIDQDNENGAFTDPVSFNTFNDNDDVYVSKLFTSNNKVSGYYIFSLDTVYGIYNTASEKNQKLTNPINRQPLVWVSHDELRKLANKMGILANKMGILANKMGIPSVKYSEIKNIPNILNRIDQDNENGAFTDPVSFNTFNDNDDVYVSKLFTSNNKVSGYYIFSLDTVYGIYNTASEKNQKLTNPINRQPFVWVSHDELRKLAVK